MCYLEDLSILVAECLYVNFSILRSFLNLARISNVRISNDEASYLDPMFIRTSAKHSILPLEDLPSFQNVRKNKSIEMTNMRSCRSEF